MREGKLARQRAVCSAEQSGEESSRQQRETQMRSEHKQGGCDGRAGSVCSVTASRDSA